MEKMVQANSICLMVNCCVLVAKDISCSCRQRHNVFSCTLFYSYLHQKEIVHGNLTLGTIFIQHNGLVKIGAGQFLALCRLECPVHRPAPPLSTGQSHHCPRASPTTVHGPAPPLSTGQPHHCPQASPTTVHRPAPPLSTCQPHHCPQASPTTVHRPAPPLSTGQPHHCLLAV